MKITRSGSLTVEAALICPVFIYAILAFIYVISWFHNSAVLQADITGQARLASSAAAAVINEDRADDAEDIVIFRRIKVGLLPVKTNHKVVMRPYVGVSSINGGEADPIVYVTPNGSVYHTNRMCSYIKVSCKKINYVDIEYRRNRSGAKYKPCEVCGKKSITSGNVYITDYGNRYHTVADCSRLYRNIIAIRLSEAGNMRQCSKCAKK